MGFIQPWHLIVILVVALAIFGPRTLGEIGGSLGRSVREFRCSLRHESHASPNEKPTDAAETAPNAHGRAKESVSDSAS